VNVSHVGGETVLLELSHAAILDEITVPSDGGDVPVLRPDLGYRSTSERARTVRSLGVDDLLGNARALASVTLTDRRLAAIGRDGGEWSWPLEEIVEVVHSATEPCTALRRAWTPDLGLLVALTDADRFRASLDAALDRGAERPEARAAFSPGAPSTTIHSLATTPPPTRRRLVAPPGIGDRVFRGGSWLGGLSVLAIMTLVGGFLLARSLHALKATGLSFLTTQQWQPDTHHFGIAAVLTFTVLIALVAIFVAVPLATGTALYISEAVPRRLKSLLVSLVDLMAAVPSVVYGLWGFAFLQGHVIGLSRWLSAWFSWIPIFKVDRANPRDPLASPSVYTAGTFVAGLVVALMIVPIACSIMREVFSQAPDSEREGAYALGATRWGMVRTVVLPFGRGGMIGAVMLALGRALGETIAVYLIISPVFKINWHILQAGSNSVASLIVLRQGDASGFGLSALMAAGLSLFVLTLIVNFSASVVVARSRSGAQTEA